MLYVWITLLVSCALVAGEGEGGGGGGVAGGGVATTARATTTRAPLRTLDRQAAELAWRSWLQSPESGNPNAPPRRITTKSLFITPLVCPKGQRLDSNGCVQVVTVNKDEHERILLEQLNALFTSAPNGDVVYDYGDEEPGPLQLSIPISLDPQAAPLHALEPSAQAQETHLSFVKVDKKDENNDAAVGLVAELELLQLQHSQKTRNDTSAETSDVLNHNVLSAVDKNKRDSPNNNSTEGETSASDEGQKELVFGHVNIDPILYVTEPPTPETTTEVTTETTTEAPVENNTTVANSTVDVNNTTIILNNSKTTTVANSTLMLTKDADKSKLNPENDYADIGEAIKLISRYAEVTTDDNFGKDKKHAVMKDDTILGTRTKLQYRRNKPKTDRAELPKGPPLTQIPDYVKGKISIQGAYPKKDVFYRYPWQGQHSPTPPPDYPFRHIQDYWPGRNQLGGVYNTGHENPRRHHHSYPHNYFRPHSLPYGNYPAPILGMQDAYPGQLQEYPHRDDQHHVRPMRSHTNNRDLYTLLGLRHWFSSEGTSKR